MVAAVEAGARVVCVTATRGERGTADPEAWPPARLAEVRDAELAAALRVLGVAEHIQLGYPDGGCAAVPVAAALHRLAGVIADVRPDTVLTFGPDGITGHADHRAVSAWTTAAVAAAGAPVPRLLYAAHAATWCDHFESLHRALGIFPAGLPHRFATEDLAIDVALPADLLDRKVASLRAQASQVTDWCRRWARKCSGRGWATSASGARDRLSAHQCEQGGGGDRERQVVAPPPMAPSTSVRVAATPIATGRRPRGRAFARARAPPSNGG